MDQKIRKPKTQRGKRALVDREAKVIENDKSTILIRGGKTSEMVTCALKDLLVIKKPGAVMFQRKNILRPFEDQTSLEFFSQKSDASLFVFGSHSKKRPNNLVLGRMFDGHVLDMFELGIEKFIPLSQFKVQKCLAGTKPCILFSGEEFENDVDFKRLKSTFIDLLQGAKVQNVRLQGLEHVIQITAAEKKIYFRSYKVQLKKSGLKTPRVELEEMGPSFDFVLRRTRIASDDLFKEALRRPKNIKPKKIKNIDHDVFGTKTGRIHMERQDIDKIQIKKVKALKRKSPKNETEKGKTKEKKRKVEVKDT